MGLSCAGALTCRHFLRVNAAVLLGPMLAGSADAKDLWPGRADYKPCAVQGTTVHPMWEKYS